MNLRHLRWRLARRIAPYPIMRDPFPAEGGVIVLYRNESGASRLEWTVRADTFRLKSTTRLAPLDYGTDTFPRYRPPATFTRFVGTLRS
jgi:hypothetical protein